MVSHWSLSESKSPQVSLTLLRILANLNIVIVWMFLNRPLISKTSSPFNNTSVTVPRASITIGINVIFMFPIFFPLPSKVQVLILSFYFLLISLNGRPGQQCPQFSMFSFFVDYDKVRSLGGARDVMVIVIGNEHGDSCSNPGREWLHFT